MKSARISELRDGLSEYLARVRRGETVIVYDRDTPIARIEPISSAAARPGAPDWLVEAEKRGIVLPPRAADAPPLDVDPVQAEGRFSLLEALLEERRSGR
jgi:antitoxin (DNA-binding transcriptional repressor) of toxin-antitoxin stability system